MTADETIQHQTWSGLADQIAALGGTRHRFNTAASNPTSQPDGTGYTLVGWGGAQEGDGKEVIGPGARLRGVLVPNNASLFRPLNTRSTGPPAERLNQLLLRPPSSDWPLDDDPKAEVVLADIGEQTQLTANPRAAYVKTLHQAQDAMDAREDVQEAEIPDNPPYGEAEFEKVRRELLTELRQVARVRSFMSKLSSPAAAGNADIFAAVSSVADRLREDLKVAADEEAHVNPFSFIEAIADLVGPFLTDSPTPQAAVNLIGAIWETAADLWDTDYGGSSTVESQPRIRADALAATLTNKARTTILGIERMGDVIVSDPVKLAEVGTYGNCSSPCNPGYEEYSTDEIDVAVPVIHRSLQRSIYENLVPLSFPVWDTGLTSLDVTQDPRNVEGFDCSPDVYSPFDNGQDRAPASAYASALDDFDPQGAKTRFRVGVMVHKGDSLFSWPDDVILQRMFGAVSRDQNPDAGGLGIVPQDFMREAVRAGPPTQYVPGGVDRENCGWNE